MTKAFVLTLSLAAVMTFAAQAQTPPQHAQHHGAQQAQPAPKPDNSSHAGHGQAAAENSPSSQAFRKANERMHKDMDIPFTGNADLDFTKGMIAHHQGAIDMAKILLTYGKDAETRKLAESIIADQEREIAQMRAWLAKNGK